MRLRTAATSVCLGLQQALLLPFLALYAVTALELPPADVAWFLIAFHGSGMVLSIALTGLADRVGHAMRIFRFVTVGAIVGFCVLAITDELAAVFAVTVILLGPSSAQNGLYFAQLRRATDDSSAALSNRGLFSIAWVLGPGLGALLVQFGGYPALFGALASVNVLIVLLTRRFRDIAGRSDPTIPIAASTARHSARVVSAFVALVFLNATNVIATTTTPVVVAEELGAGLGASGAVFGFCAAAEAVLFIALARWGSRRDPVLIILIGCVLGALYYSALGIVDSWILVLVLQVFNAAFIVSSVGAGMVWFQDLMPRHTGLATGIFLNSTRVSSVAAAPVIGGFANGFGAYQPVAFVAAALLVVPVAILILMRRSGRVLSGGER